jgi:hypothetical protein
VAELQQLLAPPARPARRRHARHQRADLDPRLQHLSARPRPSAACLTPSHFAPRQLLQAIEIYRSQFRPSAALDKPY